MGGIQVYRRDTGIWEGYRYIGGIQIYRRDTGI